MADKLRLAFIIPTIGRYQNLKRLLDSIEDQTAKVDLVVVVDAGREHSEDKVRRGYGFSIKYVYTGPSSLTEGKNTGIKNISDEIDLVGFLDDDAILYKDAIEIMLNFWQKSHPDLGGVAFNIINNRKSRKLWFLKNIFLTGSGYPGDVLASGYVTIIENIKYDVYSSWLPGGGTVWRKGIFSKFNFDESFKGYGVYEDVDFSYKVSKDYNLVVLAQARLAHKSHPVVYGSKNIAFGKHEIINRFYFISKHKEFHRIFFYWASLGNLLENLFFGIFNFNSSYFMRALGNFLGIKRIMLNYGERILRYD